MAEKLPGSPEPVEGKCGSYLRQSEEKYGQRRYCLQNPMKGRERCGLHGGKSKAGVESGTFKHGRYSKVLPAGLKKTFDEILATGEIIDLREAIALAETRQIELLTRLDGKDSALALQEAMVAWRDFRKATAEQDQGAALAARDRLDHALDPDRDESPIWAEIVDLQDHVRKLVESERKHLRENRGMVPADYALSLSARLMDAVLTLGTQYGMPAGFMKGLQDFWRTDVLGERVN